MSAMNYVVLFLASFAGGFFSMGIVLLFCYAVIKLIKLFSKGEES